MVRTTMAFRYGLPFLFLQLTWLCTTPWSLTALPCLVFVFLVGEAAFGTRDAKTSVPGPRVYRWLPRLFVPLQLSAIVLSLLLVSDPRLPPLRFAALIVAIGTMSGVFGMLSAHELIHSRSRFDRTLGLTMLAGSSYMHFRLSHLNGHHRLAATPDDPATARRGESLYRFVLRSAMGQYRQCWQMEARRIRSRKGSPYTNRMLHYVAATALLYGGAGFVAGRSGLVFLALQSLLAIFILEAFNYVAHYGLERRRRTDGRFEPLDAMHSWNTARRFSNWALFNAGGHSHHHAEPARDHAEPARAYEQLRRYDGAPELPTGYAGCIFLALVPPLWREIMDKRLPLLTSALAASARLG